MSTRLILISHAPTAATRAARFPGDEPPDEHGAAQACAASRPRQPDETRSGPEQRCQQTATALGLTPVIDPALADLDAGSWRGRRLIDLENTEPEALHAWLADPAATPHGGESLTSLLDRVAAWLTELSGRTARIVAITHPSIIRAAVVHVLHAGPESFWRIDVTPLSQTILSAHQHRWTMRETGHPLTPVPSAATGLRVSPCLGPEPAEHRGVP